MVLSFGMISSMLNPDCAIQDHLKQGGCKNVSHLLSSFAYFEHLFFVHHGASGFASHDGKAKKM
jgi:hypothetical protein